MSSYHDNGKMTLYGEDTLSTGVKVDVWTHAGLNTYERPTGCFVFIFNTLNIGNVHHAIILNYVNRDTSDDPHYIDQGRGHKAKSWAEMFESPQRMGWFNTDSSGTIRFRYRTDDGIQTPGLHPVVKAAFEEYYGRPVELETHESEEGSSTQNDYGARARRQYQGEDDPEDNEQYCSYCDEYYDPDWEDHSEEYCDECGDDYCSTNYDYHNYNSNTCSVCGEDYPDCVAGWKHEDNHDYCSTCNEYYDENNDEEVGKHDEPYCSDCDKHYPESESALHKYHRTSETGMANEKLPHNFDFRNPGYVDKGTMETWLHLTQALYSRFTQEQQTPDYGQGLYPVITPKTPAQKTIEALQKQYGLVSYYAQELVSQVEQNGQMQLFSKWQEESDAIDRGIADVSDRIVFTKLALLKLAEEDDAVLDIEANPNSQEYRWSYDGQDLHIWQVTNRHLHGPSHYDMFGSEGYGEHSQGRVYVSPDGEVGSLYWQIAHPECEDVVNEWIQTNFGKPPDAVYHAYGQYAGEPRSRWDFPLVDVYSLPLKPQERWWEVPDTHADSWYINQGQVPPGRAKTKQQTYPAQTGTQPPDQLSFLHPIKNRRKKKWQRQKDRKQKYVNRGRRGAYTTPGDSLVQKFVIQGDQVKTGKPDNLFTGDVFHADLYDGGWTDITGSGGFLVLEPTTYGQVTLYDGDVFFFDHPSPEAVQLVKRYFGNVKRIRWPGLDYGGETVDDTYSQA